MGVAVNDRVRPSRQSEPYPRKPKSRKTAFSAWLKGIGFTFIIALLGYGLAIVPGFNRVGQLACSIILAVLYRQVWGYPEQIRSGIEFSSKKLLRFAIILFGLKLNLDIVLHQGMGLLVRDAVTIFFAITVTLLLAKWLKADFSLSMLLGIGTGICGAAAIAAVSPILKAKEEDTAMGAGIIALIGTIFSIAYTILRPLLPISDIQYGIWAGVSLHEIAHVALAAAPAGQDALAIALLAKLGRVFLLVPLSFILLYWQNLKRKRMGEVNTGTRIMFPWFLVGFIAMSFLGSYVLGKSIMVPAWATNEISSVTTFILTMAMVGLGLHVNLKELRSKALRPLLAMLVTSVLLSGLTLISL